MGSSGGRPGPLQAYDVLGRIMDSLLCLGRGERCNELFLMSLCLWPRTKGSKNRLNYVIMILFPSITVDSCLLFVLRHIDIDLTCGLANTLMCLRQIIDKSPQ